ncbi:hypothetical protein ACIRPK_14695 [Kitasatospora sp. NPDC101801]|uniref:hypothetical protein n=1 Tax=Kitasatospora sp. NPDC101801 TaxID=3364103 RepID=UPI00381C6FD0
MTWMPDREAVTRRRRRTSSSQHSEPQAEPHVEPRPGRQPAPGHWPDAYENYGRIGRQREPEAHPMGIPRILRRRARWVGARLRREE